MYVDYVDADGRDVAGALNFLNNPLAIYIQSRTDVSKFVWFRSSSSSQDPGGYVRFRNMNDFESSAPSPFMDGDALYMCFQRHVGGNVNFQAVEPVQNVASTTYSTFNTFNTPDIPANGTYQIQWFAEVIANANSGVWGSICLDGNAPACSGGMVLSGDVLFQKVDQIEIYTGFAVVELEAGIHQVAQFFRRDALGGVDPVVQRAKILIQM